MNILEREAGAWLACAGHPQPEANKPHLRIGRACPVSESESHDKNMSNTTNDGGSAFPMGYHRDGNSADHQGMTLRDWLAGQALAGLIFHNDYGARSDDEIANGAYAYADAMIAARKGGTK
jgi:hypothetical protein